MASAAAPHVGTAAAEPFARRTVAVLVVVGVMLALGAILMGGFSDELSRRLGSLPAADTKHGAGFHAFRRLVEETDGGGALIPDVDDSIQTPELLILTPDVTTRSEDIRRIVEARAEHATDAKQEDGDEADLYPTLIILPKWKLAGLPLQRNRVERTGVESWSKIQRLAPAPSESSLELTSGRGRELNSGMVGWQLDASLSPDAPRIRLLPFRVPQQVQLLTGSGMVPILSNTEREAVLARVGPGNTYVLSDPDLLNNAALKHPENAQAAVALIAALDQRYPGSAAFDASLHYGAGDRNLVKLLFTPPFLSATIALIGAALLAGFATAIRFGPVLRERRTVALGKRALIDNIAALTRLAGRTASAGPRYADAAREAIVRALHVPAGTAEEAMLEAIDKAGGNAEPPYSQIDRRLRNARTEAELLAAARQLHAWRKEAKA